MNGIRAAIEQATEYLTRHPSDAVSTDTRATAVVESGLRVRVTGPGNENAVTDMVPSVGGQASAPSPGWLLRAGVASCVATLITMRAAQLGHDLSSLEVEVDSVSDDRGILGIEESVPAAPLSMRIAVRAAGESMTEAQIDELVAWGVDHCPVSDAVRRAVPVTIEMNR